MVSTTVSNVKAAVPEVPKKARPLAIGAAVLGVSALVAGVVSKLLGRKPSDGTRPTDLEGNSPRGPQDRAIEHFRPDPTAVPTAEERAALVPPSNAPQ